MVKKLGIIFCGSSDYTLPILQSLKNNFNLQAIVTSINTLSLKNFAENFNLPFFTPENSAELLLLKEKLSAFSPDLFLVADFGLWIPEEIFNLPKFRSLNIHFSMLSKYRGPSPVQYTLLNGDKSAWISIVKLVNKLDAGDIIYQKEIPLSGDETTGSLYKKLFEIVSEDLPGVLSEFAKEKIKPAKQDEKSATYTRKITRDDGFIPFDLLLNMMKGIKPTKSILENWPLIKIIPSPLSILHTIYYILQSLRAFTPWPGLWTKIEITDNKQQITKRLKILQAHIEPVSNFQLPKTNDQQPMTKLVLDQVQLEGKKPVSWKQFLQGYPQLYDLLNK